MNLTERQRSELNRVCGKLEGLSNGLAFAGVCNVSGLQEALDECKISIEKVLNDPGESVEKLLERVK